MAAKKKPASSQPLPLKKINRKPVTSANAAEKDMMDKKANSRAVAPADANRRMKAPAKAAADARGRATKYGTPSGPTTYSFDPVKSKGFPFVGEQYNVVLKTPVTSSRGNSYVVTESKTQKMGRKDSTPKTTLSPVKKPKKK